MGSLSLGLALLLVACQVALITPRTRTVKLGDHVKLENTAYIYQSVIESYLQYEAARKVGEAGLMTRAGDKDHVCYHGYGCFFKNGTYGNFWRLPASPQSVTTGFHLYRSADQEDPEFLDYKNVTTLIESSFRGDQPTVVMLHGFGSGPWSPWSGRMKAAVFRGVLYVSIHWHKIMLNKFLIICYIMFYPMGFLASTFFAFSASRSKLYLYWLECWGPGARLLGSIGQHANGSGASSQIDCRAQVS